MENKDLIEAICTMVKYIRNESSLKRIYRMVSYLLRKEAD